MRRSAGLLLAGLIVAATLPGCSLPQWPIDGGAAVASPYGVRWLGTLPGIHRGVDIRAPAGTSVRAMAPGTIRYAGWMNGFGNVIWIDHRENLLTIYAHLSEIHVSEGAEVGGDEVVGRVGSTGSATAPHLHFEVWVHGRPVDPVAFLGRRH